MEYIFTANFADKKMFSEVVFWIIGTHDPIIKNAYKNKKCQIF
jgi:hypothetical protein